MLRYLAFTVYCDRARFFASTGDKKGASNEKQFVNYFLVLTFSKDMAYQTLAIHFLRSNTKILPQLYRMKVFARNLHYT